MTQPGKHRIRRVLVVDQQPDQIRALTEFLHAEGFEVSTANSGPQALFHVAQSLPDAMLMDIDMPGMSGSQVARELKARGYSTGMRLIAVTGRGIASEHLAAADVGFELHLTKPLDTAALLAALRRPL